MSREISPQNLTRYLEYIRQCSTLFKDGAPTNKNLSLAQSRCHLLEAPYGTTTCSVHATRKVITYVDFAA